MTTYISRSLMEHARDFDVTFSFAPSEFYRHPGVRLSHYMFTFCKSKGIGYLLFCSRVMGTYISYSGYVPYLDVEDGKPHYPDDDVFRVMCEHSAFCQDSDLFGLKLDDLKRAALKDDDSSKYNLTLFPNLDRLGSEVTYHNIPLVTTMSSALYGYRFKSDEGIVWISKNGLRIYRKRYGLEVSYEEDDKEVYTPIPRASIAAVCRDHGLYVYMDEKWIIASDNTFTPLCIYTDRSCLATSKLGTPKTAFFGKELKLLNSFNIHVPAAAKEEPQMSMRIQHGLSDGKLRLYYYDKQECVQETVLCDAPLADSLDWDIEPLERYGGRVIRHFCNGFDGELSLYRDSDGAKYMCVKIKALQTSALGNHFCRLAEDNGKPVYVRFFAMIA